MLRALNLVLRSPEGEGGGGGSESAAPVPAATPAASPAEPVVSSPAAASPESSQAGHTPADSAPAPAPAESGAPETPASPEAPAPEADAAPKPYEPAPSLLEEGADKPAPAKEGEKPAEPPKEAKKEEAPTKETAPAPAEAPSQPDPASIEFQLPEGVDASQVNPERLGALKTILFDPAKEPAAKGSELLKLHFDEINQAVRSEYSRGVKAFEDLRDTRRAEVAKDSRFGGNRSLTALQEAFQVVQKFGGDEAERSRLLSELRSSAMGDSLAFLKLLGRVHDTLIKEPEPVSPSPPRAPAPTREQRGKNRYANSPSAAG